MRVKIDEINIEDIKLIRRYCYLVKSGLYKHIPSKYIKTLEVVRANEINGYTHDISIPVEKRGQKRLFILGNNANFALNIDDLTLVALDETIADKYNMDQIGKFDQIKRRQKRRSKNGRTENI